MHPLRGLAIVTCITLFLLGAIGWMLPVSATTSGTDSPSTGVPCGSILRPSAAGSTRSEAIESQCTDAREFRGLLGAIGMGAGIVGLGLAISIDSSQPPARQPQLRLITNQEIEAKQTRYRPRATEQVDTTRVH